MFNSGRPILAAPSGGESAAGREAPDQGPQQPSKLGGKPNRTVIESACVPCRKRKSKCDGLRPACSRCQSLKTNCVYETKEGESRWKALLRRKQDVESDRDDLRKLLKFLQTWPEGDALDIFHRIRTNGFEDLLRLIRHAREDGHSISSQHLVTPENVPSDRQWLPPIRTMLGSNVDKPPQNSDAQLRMLSPRSRK